MNSGPECETLVKEMVGGYGLWVGLPVFEHLSFPRLGKLLLRRGGLMMGADGQGKVTPAYYRVVQDKVFQHPHIGQMLKHQSLETWLIY